MNAAPESRAPSGIVRRLVRLKGILVAISLVGLLASNLATLLSAGVYDLLYTGVRKVALLAGDAIADRVTRHSKQADLEETKARHAQTSAELDERGREARLLREQKARVDAELDETKARYAKTSAELADERAAAKGIRRDLDDLKARRARDSKSAKEVAGGVRARLAKNIARNTAAIPAEAIPYVGIGVILSVTALDIYDACQTMGEINSLLILLGQGTENADFCGQKLPTKEEVVAGLKDEWRKSLQFVVDQAKNVPTQVPVPQVRLPTVDETKAAACSIITFPGC